MASVTRSAQNVEITAESLQRELIRLETQKQALERELAAVAAHLGSVQRALGTLEGVLHGAGSPADAPGAAAPGAPAAAPPRSDSGTTRRAARHTESDTSAGTTYGRLTEQILDFLGTAGGAEVRARDVAAALGRDRDSGSINAVRSTLDRLVGAGRIQRAGRGLYRAHPS
ncbi:hypothetical protein [Streptomyces sp. NPDC026673]|uniref:hypothetical protein n=1 Tax=Streptomyces sp. NPDC026673 TaxID=3155724 RepID=UPI0033C2DA89